MRDVVHRCRTTPCHVDDCRVGVDAEILRYLVVGALEEGAEHRPYRMQSAFRHPRNHRYGLLFCNPHIDVLPAGLPAFLRREACNQRRTRRDGDEPAVLFHLLQHPVADQLIVGLVCRLLRPAAVCHVERHAVMPCLLVLYGGGEAMPLLGVDVDDCRPVRVFHTAEHLDEFLHVVPFFQVSVFKSPCLEPVVPAGAVAFAQGTQILVDTAVVFSNGHFVVVYDDDDACAESRCLVQSLESLTAGERTVTDDSDDVLLRTLDVAGFLQPGGKAYGSGGVPHLEVVVLRAFRRR